MIFVAGRKIYCSAPLKDKGALTKLRIRPCFRQDCGEHYDLANLCNGLDQPGKQSCQLIKEEKWITIYFSIPICPIISTELVKCQKCGRMYETESYVRAMKKMERRIENLMDQEYTQTPTNK